MGNSKRETKFFCIFAAMKFKLILFLIVLQSVAQQPLRAQIIDNSLQYVPMAAAIGLDFCGVEARHPLRERIAVAATSYAALTVATGALKLTVKEWRPDGSDYRSFPSGHAARAFAGAELVRSEYGWQWGIGAYAVAAGVGILRITGDHHYTHDVLAGAAVGVLSARLAYWALPWERKIFGWEEKDFAVTALPTYDHTTRTVGLAFQAVIGR